MKTIFLLLLLLYSSLDIKSSEQYNLFKPEDKINITNGLAHNGVTSMLYDSRGYLWIGTYDGLNCYNGYSTITYKNTLNNRSFQTNRIRTIKEDLNGNIWLGTDNGVTLYDYFMGSFKELAPKKSDVDGFSITIRRIFISSKSKRALCISENNGIFLYNWNGDLLRHDKAIDKSICVDGVDIGNDKYLLATSKGLKLYDLNSGKIKNILAQQINNPSAVFKINGSEILVADNKGIHRIKYSLHSNNYSFDISDYNYLNYKDVYSISLDGYGGLWIGTVFNGFIYISNYNSSNMSSTNYLPNVRISGFLPDKKGGMWVSTFDDGVFHYEKDISIFKSCNISNLKKSKLIAYDSNRVILLSDLNNKYLYNLKDNQLEVIPGILQKSSVQLYAQLFKDRKGNYWKKDDSFALTEIVNGKPILRQNEKLKLLGQGRFSVSTQDLYGDIWLAYQDNLFRLSLDDNDNIVDVESVYDNSFFLKQGIRKIRVVYSDPLDKSLWVGSDVQGLFQIKLDKRRKLKDLKILHYYNKNGDATSLSSNFVSSIIRMPDKTLWIGTEQGGLCKAIENKKGLTFKTFSEKDGLSNNVVKSLVCDKKGRLWIATNIGLNLYNPINSSFYVYRTEDGLPFEDFWYSSMCMPDGTIVLSSFNNTCYFNSNLLPQKESLPSVYISSLNIYNKAVEIGKDFNGRIILDHRIKNNDCISLKYDENVFSLDVDAIYKSKSTNHYIYYCLEGSNKEWVKIPARNQRISFDGLAPGKYKLHIKASNSLGEFSKEKILNIEITPPFWKTIYAYFIYVLLILLILYLFLHFFMRLQRLKHELMIEDMEKQNLKTINSEKQRFFSNISHELKTPLTLILAPLTALSERFYLDVDVNNKINIIKRQTKKMLQLIDLSHDIEKSDCGLLKVEYTTFSFNDFINEIVNDFSFMAKYDNKELSIKSPDMSLLVSADKSMMEKIINNILTNAFKHTKGGDKIEILYRIKESTNNILEILISDTGYGISESDLPHIFEIFYQAKKGKEKNIGGAGIGLTFTKKLIELHSGKISVESKLEEGTTFTVLLPIVVEQQPLTEEMKENKELGIKTPLIIGDSNLKSIEVNSEFSNSLVLIVEDDPEMRLLLTNIISPFFRVKSLTNGIECMEMMKEEWPDVIVSDVMMPEMDGYELCSKIKTDMKTSHIPIILITACSTVDEKIKGLKAGADSYIYKPFYPKHVITRIEMLLENRKQLRERFQVGIPLSYGSKANSLAKDNEFLEKLYTLFSNNLSNEDIDIDSFALELGVNRTMFYQKVKALTNDSPYELLKKYRLKRAAELLENKDLNINEICALTGFKSRTHFGRLFKELYNVSPSKYSSTVNNKKEES